MVFLILMVCFDGFMIIKYLLNVIIISCKIVICVKNRLKNLFVV